MFQTRINLIKLIFMLMGKPLLGFILITQIRVVDDSCNQPDGLSPRKQNQLNL